jgi:cobyrinic acid a,c-diamide synthase
MARSAAALVRGFEIFDPDLDLAGVVFNRIGGDRHAGLLRESVSGYCRTAAFGCLPRNAKISIPSRHLGLALAPETLTDSSLEEMAAWIEANLDLDNLLRLVRDRASSIEKPRPVARAMRTNVRIGVAQDRAFCFYYQDNLDFLALCGAELVPFSPMADGKLPEHIDGLYLGGGYPELHAGQLSGNISMLRSIREFAQSGAPVYAECGGFMYLTEAVVDIDGREHPMAGIFPTRARMQPRLAALGYVQPEPVEGCLWARGCQNLRGHEFRYSTIDPMPSAIARVYREPVQAYRKHSVLAGYIHLHFLASPDFAEQFVQHCAERQLTTTQ